MVKRRIILGLMLLLLTACTGGGAGEGADSGSAARILGPEGLSPYQLFVSSADLAPGTSRLVLTIWDGEKRLSGVQELSLSLFRLDEKSEMQEEIWSGTATGYLMDGEQYWVSYPTFPAPGNYGGRVRFKTAEGEQVENDVYLRVKEQPEAPAVGAPAPLSESRTLDEAPVEELTSAPPYVERFYQMSVKEAVQSGKPTIIVFATPGYCTSRLCAPVMETVKEVSDELGDAVNVVHVEIYRDYASEEVDPVVHEWNLPSEPWLFVVAEDGTIGARLDGLVGAEELRQAVRELSDG